jgi:hypothetical protein
MGVPEVDLQVTDVPDLSNDSLESRPTFTFAGMAATFCQRRDCCSFTPRESSVSLSVDLAVARVRRAPDFAIP